MADGRRSALLVQTGELLGFSALAALAVQRDSPGLLGASWLAHVIWDALHHRGRGPTRVPSWYPALCIGYDVAVATPLLTGLASWSQLGHRFAVAFPGASTVASGSERR